MDTWHRRNGLEVHDRGIATAGWCSGATRDRRSDRARREDAPGEKRSQGDRADNPHHALDHVNRKETKR